MRNVYINEAETIFEAFWDCGDTYQNHQKYNCMEKYKVSGDGEYRVGWNSIQVMSFGSFVISRDLELDISDFDTLNLCMYLPSGMNVRVKATVDGKVQEILYGADALFEFEGSIRGKKLTNIELEFLKVDDIKAFASLFWLGLVNSEKREKMLNRDNGFHYPDCWEGCFKEDFDAKLHLSAYLDENELSEIRKKIKSGELSIVFRELEIRAEKYLHSEPEKFISEYVTLTNSIGGFLPRKRDKGFPRDGMEILAFVGLVNEDKRMLKMACRIALCAACCDKWTEGIKGAFPGATWHHRSFLEASLGYSCCKVLDWAGEALTWHGQNIIYDAIIMKALPRIEADIYTMDYIWHMNQGIVFTSVLINILLVLGKRYPRYLDMIDKYEAALCEMWENYVNEDGGCGEGPGYWNYSAIYFMVAFYYMAKSKKKSLAEYIPESLKKAEFYAKGILSTVGDGSYHIPINDTHYDKGFDLIVPAFFANAGEDKKYWCNVFRKSIKDVEKLTMLVDFIILASNAQENEDIPKLGYIPLINTGMLTLARETDDLGVTALFVQGGLSEPGGHEHEDKGSFIIEAGGREIISDRGTNYRYHDAGAFGLAKWHNLIYPEIEKEAHQLRRTKGAFGKFLKSEYKDGILECVIDVSSAWDGIFKKNIRTIISPDSKLFIIYDSIECDCDITFRANTYGKLQGNMIDYGDIKLYVHTLNWKPYKITDDIDGVDGRLTPVNLLKLYSKPGELVTVFELSAGESKVKICNNQLTYKDFMAEFKDGRILINKKTGI